MIDAMLQIATASASVITLIRCEPAIGRMTCHTHLMVRLSIWLLCVSSLAQVGAITLLGHIPTTPELLLSLGVASLLMCERRMRVLIPRPNRRVRQ